MGALVALPLFGLLARLPAVFYAAAVLGLLAVGIWAAGEA